jgi:photosystem II stability/assembly factor-like uncharacterized protein
VKRLVKRLFITLLLTNIFSSDAQSWKRNDFTSLGNIVDAAVFGDTIISISQLGYIIKSNDFGNNWTIDSSYVTYGDAFQSMYFVNRQRGYISCLFYSSILNTLDGGKTWTPLANGNARGGIGHVLQFTDTIRGYGGDYGEDEIKKTVNGGLTWAFNRVNNNCQAIFRIQFFDSTKGYLLGGTTNGQDSRTFLYKTINGGGNWSLVDSTPFQGIGDFVFVDTNTVYLIFTHRIFKSSDDLTTIDTLFQSTSISSSMFDITHAISFPNRDTGFLAFSGSIFKTVDGGNTLIQTDFTSADSPEDITCIKASSSKKAVIGTNNGNIYVTTVGGGTYNGVKNDYSYPDFFIYPNPAKNELQFSNLPILNSSFQYSIVNILGQTKQSNTLLPNNTSPSINVSALPAGIYFIRLTYNKGFVYSAKFVKE